MTTNQKAKINTNSSRGPVEERGNYFVELFISLIPRPTIAYEGWLRMAILFGLGIVAWWAAKWAGWLRPVGNALAALGTLTAFAYRDPERENIGRASDYFYAPVDGKVISVAEIADEPIFVGGPAYKIEIASHPLDVPIQRTPIPAQVRYINQPANEPISQLGLEISGGQRLLLTFQPDTYQKLRLPTPLAAPLISFRTEAGRTLTSIEKIGVRGFGNPLLTTLYLPVEGSNILCRIGEHIQAGMTIIGRIPPS